VNCRSVLSWTRAATRQHVAVIGTGCWGRELVRVLGSLGALDTVCDADQSRLDALETDVAVRRCCRAEDCLRDPDVSAVAIATPVVSHFELARSALKAGKDVLVEKPLALTVKDGHELVRLARDSNRILMVGNIMRYHPAVRKLKDMIDSGELGKIEYIYSNRQSIGSLRAEEHILWSFAPHEVSVILDLLGEMPTAASCQGGDYVSRGVSDVTVNQFVFAGGLRAQIFVSWLRPLKEQWLVVVGSDKMAVFGSVAPDMLVTYHHRDRGKWVPPVAEAAGEPVSIDATDPMMAQCMAFLESLDTRR
jgi:UDP-2-acetamido-3-amino-2,3-dideoxy-glucuronate N-acetyltransferase